MPTDELARRLLPMLRSGQVATKAGLHQAKQALARELRLDATPTDREVAAAIGAESAEHPVLRTKPMRSMSGVAVVAVMSSPASCPHGKCTFCPGGPEVDAPQSYTGFEPSTLRARRHSYNPYAIVRDRLRQLALNGHAVDKVELVVQGGTFPARDEAYQDWFVTGLYEGLNAGPAARGEEGLEAHWPEWTEGLAGPGRPTAGELGGRTAGKVAGPAAGKIGGLAAGELAGPAGGELGGPAGEPGAAPPGSGAHAGDGSRPRGGPRAIAAGDRLADAMRRNEVATCRAVGLTIETKPDWCLAPHLDAMLRHGATRIEVGLQALDDDVLVATHRGHTLEDSRKAMQLARDAGFKVCVHMMPGLPRLAGRTRGAPGSLDPDPEADLEDMRRLFADPEWRPDMLKVYPTLVVAEGETTLKRQWQRGEYTPYSTDRAAQVVGRGKGFVPEWCRIQRVDRDIPTTHVEAGVLNSNLRQLAQAWRAKEGLAPCRCVRCREAGRREAAGVPVDPARVSLVRRSYEASGGLEEFLGLEDPVADAVVGFLRLRRVSADAHRVETRVADGAAFVRELKVYGTARRLGEDDPEEGAWQHQGHGARLLAEAERIAFHEWRVGSLLVIAGVGVKQYYRRHGYVDVGPYVGKARPGGAPWPQALSPAGVS